MLREEQNCRTEKRIANVVQQGTMTETPTKKTPHTCCLFIKLSIRRNIYSTSVLNCVFSFSYKKVKICSL